MRTPMFSVEAITLPVSDVERALRFDVDQSASRSTSTTRERRVPRRAARFGTSTYR